MHYWQDGVVFNGLLIAAMLLVGSLIVRLGPLEPLGIPVSIAGGVLALLLGPDVANLLPWDRPLLESVVYHGLAVVFIAVSLQSPPPVKKGGGVRSMALAIPMMGALQGLVALAAVLGLGLVLGRALHPGLGVLLPYGFEQGPGPALSIGAAWEESYGMTDGSEIGLIFAAFGFGWAIVFGVPLVMIGRARGWASGPVREEVESAAEAEKGLGPGTLEVLTSQAVAIGVVYLATYGLLEGIAAVLGEMDLVKELWGFHYIVGALLAIPVRVLLERRDTPSPLNDESLGRINGLTVDVITCAALAAVQIGVFRENWFVIVLVTTLAGTVTLLAALWLSSRAFPDEPFEHAVALFGMATGTLPVGLALLRILDPDLRGSVPTSCVLGSAASVPIAGALYLGIMPMPARQWMNPAFAWGTLGGLLLFVVGLVVAWRAFGPLRMRVPLTLWAPREEAPVA